MCPRTKWTTLVCSNNLHDTEVKETGQYFEAKCFSPFSKMGTKGASLQSSGTIPISSESWNSFIMIGTSSEAKSCRNYVGTASGPAALCTCRPFSSLHTPLLPTWMLLIVGFVLSPLDSISERSSFE